MQLAVQQFLDSQAMGGRLNDLQSYLADMLDTSHRQLNQAVDLLPPPQAKTSQSSSWLPRKQVVNEALFEHYSEDTLFFIFYFQKNSFQQFLAARELKKRNWRFHKQYITWFRRLEQPKVTNEKYEEGSFVFFDYDQGNH